MKRITDFSKSREFSRQIQEVIPGGAHTYSKGDDQFPYNAPGAITHGKGAHVWDIDGNEFVDCSMGIYSVGIGHGYEPVAKAVAAAATRGTNFSRPSSIELEAAREFLATVKSGEMVKFGKNGSTVTTAAVKLSRAFTGKAKVAIAQEHPFFSYDDWFIGATEADFGVPEAVKQFTVRFRYNDIDSVKQLFAGKDHDIACLILEPVKFTPPVDGFLHKVAEICKEHGALLILDEMICGFKFALGGAQEYFDVKCDLTTWGKGIANGFSACALTGRADVMELGGIRRTGAPKLFLTSTTHGAETTGLAALLATMEEFERHDMIASNWQRGHVLQTRMAETIVSHGLSDYLEVAGYPCFFSVGCRDAAKQPSDGFKTLMMQEMIARGVLYQGILFTTWSHQAAELDTIAAAFDESCGVYKQAIKSGGYESFLVGPPIKPVFRKRV